MKPLLALSLILLAWSAHAGVCDNIANTVARNRCLKAQTQAMIKRSHNAAVVDCKPGDNGSDDATCYRNNVDSTCYHADGSRAAICGQPDCAYESYEYGTGTGPGRCGRCPPHTKRANLPPDEDGRCDPVTEPPFCPGCGGKKLEALFLAPGHSASESLAVAVPPGAAAEISASAELAVAGDPVGDLAAFVAAAAGAEQVGTTLDYDVATKMMADAVEAIEAGHTVTLSFTSTGWAGTPPSCEGSVPTPPSVVQNDFEWGGGVRATIPGGSACGSYGQITVSGTIENAAPQEKATVTLIKVASKVLSDGCPEEPPSPLPRPTEAPGPGALPTIQVLGVETRERSCVPQTHKEYYSCGTEKQPATCSSDVHSPADGSLDVTAFLISYQINAPSVRVTKITVTATGGGGVGFGN